MTQPAETTDAGFDESKVRRDADGQFSENGGGKEKAKKQAKAPPVASVTEVSNALADRPDVAKRIQERAQQIHGEVQQKASSYFSEADAQERNALSAERQSVADDTPRARELDARLQRLERQRDFAQKRGVAAGAIARDAYAQEAVQDALAGGDGEATGFTKFVPSNTHVDLAFEAAVAQLADDSEVAGELHFPENGSPVTWIQGVVGGYFAEYSEREVASMKGSRERIRALAKERASEISAITEAGAKRHFPEEFSHDSIELAAILSRYPRIAITGAPRCGKSTISNLVTDRQVVHTDPNDLKARFGEPDDETDWSKSQEVWNAAPAFIGQMCAGRDAFVVEGVTVARALRKGSINVDAVILLTKPIVEQTPGQAQMGAQVLKIFEQWRAKNPDVPVFDGTSLVPPIETTTDSSAVRRYETWTLDSGRIERTPQGGIRVPATLTRVGVFEYNRGGTVIREYRPPEEVFAEESIATLRGCTVVVNHPYSEGGEVTPLNYKRLNVGHIEEPRQEGDAIVGYVVINDAETIAKIEQRKLRELSCGYDNVRDPTPGTTPDGKPYHVVQRRIRYNHTALLPDGLGRQGSSVGLTLDAADNQLPETAVFPRELKHTEGSTPMPNEPNKPAAPAANATAPAPAANTAPPNTDAAPAEGAPAPATLSGEEIQALKLVAQAAPALLELVKTSTAAVSAPAPATDAAPGAGAASPTEEEKKTMDAKDQELRIQEGVELREVARPILGDKFNFGGKTNREIRLAVVKTMDSKFDDKASDDKVSGAFSMAVQMHADRAKNTEALGKLRGTVSKTTDSADQRPAIGAHAYEAWKTPKKSA